MLDELLLPGKHAAYEGCKEQNRYGGERTKGYLGKFLMDGPFFILEEVEEESNCIKKIIAKETLEEEVLAMLIKDKKASDANKRFAFYKVNRMVFR